MDCIYKHFGICIYALNGNKLDGYFDRYKRWIEYSNDNKFWIVLLTSILVPINGVISTAAMVLAVSGRGFTTEEAMLYKFINEAIQEETYTESRVAELIDKEWTRVNEELHGGSKEGNRADKDSNAEESTNKMG